MDIKTVNLKFNRKSEILKKDKKSRIWFEIYWSRSKRQYLPTEFLITEDEWDYKNKCVKPINDHYKFINGKLKAQVSKIETFEYSQKLQNKIVSPEIIKDFLSDKIAEFETTTFNKFYKEKLKNRSFNTIATFRHHQKTFNKLNSFNKELYFHEINIEFVEQFDWFLKELGLKLNSRSNHHKNIKANLHIAASEGYIDYRKLPYATQIGGSAGKFKIKKEEGSLICLDFEELKRVEGLRYLDTPHLEKSRKIFLFMCYTGLRISDMESFRIDHLHHSSSGYKIDLKKMIKTRKSIYLDLYELFNGNPQKILKEYLVSNFGTDDYNKLVKLNDNSPVFGKISGQKINPELKIIADDANIHKKLSCHVGRHTFGTHLAVLSNGNISLIRDLMGHGKTETTMIYIKLAERMRGELIKKIDWDSQSETTVEKSSTKVVKEIDERNEDQIKNLKIPEEVKYSKQNEQKEELQCQQIKDYIYDKVIPSLSIPTEGKALFWINDDSIKIYVSKLPFSSNDYASYQNNPIEIQGFVGDPELMKHIEGIQEQFDNHSWVKSTCMKLVILFTPILNKEDSILI